MQAELVLDCKNHHGEGVFWNPQDKRLWWTDIHGEMLLSYDPISGDAKNHSMPSRVACFAPRKNGGLIVAFAQSIVLFDLDKGALDTIHDFEPDNPNTRLNDGRTDRQGRLIVGGMNEGTGDANSTVLRIDHDLTVTPIIEGVSCANSTCFSVDGSTMYFTDTPEKTIRAYPYNVTDGSLGPMSLHCDMSGEPGLPDGSCVDAEGGVWNAEWEGRRVIRIAPDGTIDRVFEVPVWKPTCCAFGGENLDTLFITTSRLASPQDVLDREPASGGLFAVKPGVNGVEDAPFSG
ncbi:SMP-30/gluconolactonase/LRE family protein [Labrenzia sp. PHM005]|uniref:SMP-30/gluconolactonase/LRE family protein n=1 Tax=Labrenzia sp. PHM005 TaxID=2590016 RepID=UPI0011408E9F|nr:SMP-30/gluconolactonase/LRE family protein [Labrenzia sp. PHM005]QDG75387.1 SMP-30/gluconolactonase/LRE family protein [Labrenzia sp. PHM005]